MAAVQDLPVTCACVALGLSSWLFSLFPFFFLSAFLLCCFSPPRQYFFPTSFLTVSSVLLFGAHYAIFFPAHFVVSFCCLSPFFPCPVLPAPLSRKDALLGLIDSPLEERLTGGGLTRETDVREGRRDERTGDLFHE